MNAKQWQIDLASDLGGEDARAAVEEWNRALQSTTSLSELEDLVTSDPTAGWDEQVRARVAHERHSESSINGPDDVHDPFVWDDETVAAYYAGYARAAKKRAREIAAEMEGEVR